MELILLCANKIEYLLIYNIDIRPEYAPDKIIICTSNMKIKNFQMILKAIYKGMSTEQLQI